MSIMELGALGEFVGAFAVVATLIYLAVQIRQNTRQARLASIQAVNASNDSAFEPIYIPENTRIWTTGLASPNELDESEQRVFDLLMTRLIACFDTATYQYEHGAYDPELYEGTGAFLRFVRHDAWGNGMVQSATRGVLSSYSGLFRSGFSQTPRRTTGLAEPSHDVPAASTGFYDSKWRGTRTEPVIGVWLRSPVAVLRSGA